MQTILCSKIYRKKDYIGNCTDCRDQLISTSSSDKHSFIVKGKFNPNLLLKPGTQFRGMLVEMLRENEVTYLIAMQTTIRIPNLQSNIFNILHFTQQDFYDSLKNGI